MDSVPDIGLGNYRMEEGDRTDMTGFKIQVEEASIKVAKLEQELCEVEHFYSVTSKRQGTTPRGSLSAKDKDKEKQFAHFKKRHQDSSASRRMQDLMRQFGVLLRQLTMHKWAEPFMQPVDVVGLGLHDYFQVIEKPMDFSTVKNKMDAKDGTGYKNVREICADVRLIFKNAMKYNEDRDDVHIMAKTLLAKFEEKWLQLLPKVDEEERRRKEEEAEGQFEMQLAQEANYAKMARDLTSELDDLDNYLEDLKEMVLQNCRKMSYQEKKSLSKALTQLSPEDLNSALMIIAQDNPGFQAIAEEVDIDIDAQSELTLWKLKFFVKEATQGHNKMPGDKFYNGYLNEFNKRKSENYEFLGQTPPKRVGNNFSGY